MLLEVDEDLAQRVGDNLGLQPERLGQPMTDDVPPDADPEHYYSAKSELPIAEAPSLSMATKLPADIKARRIAILTADGVADEVFTEVKKVLCELDAMVMVIAPKHGFVTTASGDQYMVDESLLTASSVLFDAVYVPDGGSARLLANHHAAIHFVAEAFKHCKPIAAAGEGVEILKAALPQTEFPAPGVSTDGDLLRFIEDIKKHRFWEREDNPLPV